MSSNCNAASIFTRRRRDGCRHQSRLIYRGVCSLSVGLDVYSLSFFSLKLD